MKEFNLELVKHINPKSGIGNRHLQEVYRRVLQIEGNVLEIGSFRGRSTVAFAWGVKDRGNDKLFCIDPWNAQGVTIENHIDNVKQAGCDDVVVRIQDLSWNVLKRRKPEELFLSKLGILFIDGNHKESSVERDLRWVELVRKGGFVICHDYGPGLNTKIPGPKLAIDKFNRKNKGVLKQINLIGNLIVFKKLI